MFKLLATTASALLASASSVSAYYEAIEATVADTCTVVNFTQRAADFVTLNSVVDLATNDNNALIKTFLVGYDPYLISNQTVDDIPFSVLGVDFTLSPTVESMNLTGLTLVTPYHINATDDNSVQVAAYFNGELSIDASFSLEITQDHKWYQICWTNILHPIKCPPATIGADVQLALQVPIVNVSLDASMYNCKAGLKAATCSNFTVGSILTGVITNNLATVVTSIEKHLINASVASFEAGFDSINNIEFTFHDTNALINALINGLLDFSADALNKKKTAYKTFIAVFNTVFKSILNDLIASEVTPLLGATCL